MWKVIEELIPSIANYCSNKKIRNKIKKKDDLDFPSKDAILENITIQELKNLYDSDLRWKDKLEDKAKTNVIGVTISVTLIMGAYTLIQYISSKFGNSVLFWIGFALFILSVAYMLEAGIHAIHVLTVENVIYYPTPGHEEEELKNNLNLQIGLNRAQNTLRNNFVFTSYECIRNALICLFVVMVIAIMPIQENSADITSYKHGNYFYSGEAVTSFATGVEKEKVEAFIDTNITDGDYSVVDQADNLFIKYSISNGKVTVFLIEPLD